MPLRVLIVDDHVGFRGFARRLLAALGMDVVGEVGDGLAALAEVARVRPDLVLLDVLLPDLDGFEVARRCAGGASAAGRVDLESYRRGFRRAA